MTNKLPLLLFLHLLTFNSVAQTEGNAIFNTPVIHEVQMTFTQPDYWDSLTAYYVTDEYLRASVVIDGLSYPDVGIKFKGNSSYTGPGTKKSFKVDMNEYTSGQDVDGLKKFNLNNCFKDPSFLREKLTLDFCAEHGIPAPRCTYSRVFINGAYWGLYTLVEEADNGTFLSQRFDNKQGNMFKGDPSGDLRWLGPGESLYYPKYELKTNETANDWSDLVTLLDNINNSGASFHDSLESSFNTSGFIKNWGVDNVFANLDSYIGSGHNYFIYHDTLSDKFQWVTWDVNEAFGNFKMGMTAAQIENLSLFHVSTPSSSRPLVQKMLLDPDYKSSLVSTVCEWLQHDFSNPAMDPKIDSLVDAIRADVYADTKKVYSNAHFEDNIHSSVTFPAPGGGTDVIMGIKPFIAARRAALIAELSSLGCTVGITEETGNIQLQLYPNPASDLVTVVLDSDREADIIVLNSLGQVVMKISADKAVMQFSISSLSPGFYYVSCGNAGLAELVVIR